MRKTHYSTNVQVFQILAMTKSYRHTEHKLIMIPIH